MTAYELLDAIADTYTPLLALFALAALVLSTYRKHWATLQLTVLYLFFGLLFTYGLQWLDNNWGTWARLGLDYSTHTAAATSLVFILIKQYPKQRIAIALSLGAYCALMLYQQYHSLLDIVTTFITIQVLLFGVATLKKKQCVTE